VTLLAEILFPGGDDTSSVEMDLGPLKESNSVLDEMDRQEQSFANNLRKLLEERGVTQAELAEKLGIGQPAISMMLQRQCRPQKRTVARIAEALGVEPSALWPD
jgi:lambda repressor-like predicted transcriptional regulator